MFVKRRWQRLVGERFSQGGTLGMCSSPEMRFPATALSHHVHFFSLHPFQGLGSCLVSCRPFTNYSLSSLLADSASVNSPPCWNLTSNRSQTCTESWKIRLIQHPCSHLWCNSEMLCLLLSALMLWTSLLSWSALCHVHHISVHFVGDFSICHGPQAQCLVALLCTGRPWCALMRKCLCYTCFILFMGFSRQEYWSGLPFPSLVNHILS